ncbi:MAG: DUF4215 domain-containing protein [Nanoarchaeota archaeon]
MNKKLLFIFLINFFLILTQVSANSGEVCKIIPLISSGNNQQGTYDVRVNSPILISSREAGNPDNACGAAVFSGAMVRSSILGLNGQPLTRAEIINMCSNAGHISTGGAGTFDEYLAMLITELNKDLINYYQITIMRSNNFTDAPIIIRPEPQTSYRGDNVRIKLYRPYNFKPSDIVEGMRKVNVASGGIVLGGVHYNESNVDLSAHMVQPIGIESAGHLFEGSRRYYFQEYDPYLALTMDKEIGKDSIGRWYSNFWDYVGGTKMWFHLEEFLYVEKLGRYSPSLNWTGNRSGGSGGSSIPRPSTGSRILPPPQQSPAPAPITGPTTPTSCGTRDLITNTCNVNRACPQNQYCSFETACTCKASICGDRIKDPGEQCDDGNRNDNDGCSAQCKTELMCGSRWMLKDIMECSPPGTGCLSLISLSVGICSDTCQCNPIPLIIR